MKLTKEQKQQLKELKKHPGFKVLELIEQEATNELGRFLLKSDLNDTKTLEIIKQNQIYMKARQDFLNNIEDHLKDIYIPSYTADNLETDF